MIQGESQQRRLPTAEYNPARRYEGHSVQQDSDSARRRLPPRVWLPGRSGQPRCPDPSPPASGHSGPRLAIPARAAASPDFDVSGALIKIPAASAASTIVASSRNTSGRRDARDGIGELDTAIPETVTQKMLRNTILSLPRTSRSRMDRPARRHRHDLPRVHGAGTRASRGIRRGRRLCRDLTRCSSIRYTLDAAGMICGGCGTDRSAGIPSLVLAAFGGRGRPDDSRRTAADGAAHQRCPRPRRFRSASSPGFCSTPPGGTDVGSARSRRRSRLVFRHMSAPANNGIQAESRRSARAARRLDTRDDGVAFQPGDGLPLLAGARQDASTSIPQGRRRPTTIWICSATSRTSGCAAGRSGDGCRKALADKPILRLRDRRQHGRAQIAHRVRRFPDRLRAVQRHAAGRCLPEGRRTGSRSAPPARAGCGSPSSTWRSIAAASASSGSRSALGDQADQDGRDAHDGAVQAARHRSGADAAAGARHPVHLHHAEAARSAVREDLAQEGGHQRRLLRRHGDDSAVSSIRRRRTAGRHLFRAHLRQHADGTGGAQYLG